MGLLTFAACLVILLAVAVFAAVFAVFKHPPTIHAEILLPAPNVSRQIAEPISTKPDPIPQEILDYIDAESDEYARVTRRNRARTLKVELGTWDAVFRALQREDDITR